MAKFLLKAKFTAQGLQAVQHEGWAARRDALRIAVEGLGGNLESAHAAFGEYDTYSIVELPDNLSAAGLSLAVSATGTVRTEVVVLLTAEEADAALHRAVAYRPAGT